MKALLFTFSLIALFCSSLADADQGTGITYLKIIPPESYTSSWDELRGYKPYLERNTPVTVQNSWQQNYQYYRSSFNSLLDLLKKLDIKQTQALIEIQNIEAKLLQSSTDYMLNSMNSTTLTQTKSTLERLGNALKSMSKQIEVAQQRNNQFKTYLNQRTDQMNQSLRAVKNSKKSFDQCNQDFNDITALIGSFDQLTHSIAKLGPELQINLDALAKEIQNERTQIDSTLSTLNEISSIWNSLQIDIQKNNSKFNEQIKLNWNSANSAWIVIGQYNNKINECQNKISQYDQQISSKARRRDELLQKSKSPGINSFELMQIQNELQRTNAEITTLQNYKATETSNSSLHLQNMNNTGAVITISEGKIAQIIQNQQQLLLQTEKSIQSLMDKNGEALTRLENENQRIAGICSKTQQLSKNINKSELTQILSFERKFEYDIEQLSKNSNGIIQNQNYFNFAPESNGDSYEGKNLRYLTNRQIYLFRWQEQDPTRFHEDLLLFSAEMIRGLDRQLSIKDISESDSFHSSQMILHIQNAAANITSIGMSFIPILSQAKDLVDLYLGKDSITQETFSDEQKILIAVGLVLPAGGHALSKIILQSEKIAARITPTLFKEAFSYLRGAETVEKFGPASPIKGPLEDLVINGVKIGDTFRSSTYLKVTSKEEIKLYRVYNTETSQLGAYWARTKPTGPLQTMLDQAIHPSFNRATNWIEITVPKGVTFYEGAAAKYNLIDKNGHSIGSLLGGGGQIFINDLIPTSWITNKGTW